MSAAIGWLPPAAVLDRLDRLRAEHPTYALSAYWRGRDRPPQYHARGTLGDHPYAVVSVSLAEIEAVLGGAR